MMLHTSTAATEPAAVCTRVPCTLQVQAKHLVAGDRTMRSTMFLWKLNYFPECISSPIGRTRIAVSSFLSHAQRCQTLVNGDGNLRSRKREHCLLHYISCYCRGKIYTSALGEEVRVLLTASNYLGYTPIDFPFNFNFTVATEPLK